MPATFLILFHSPRQSYLLSLLCKFARFGHIDEPRKLRILADKGIYTHSLIRYTGQFKWPAVIGGIPFMILGTALLIHFRTPSADSGYLVMCQIFNGIGSGFLATCGQLAVMAAVTHQDVAMVIALYGLFGGIGASIGMAIAGALWTNLLRNEIYDALPTASKNLTDTIYADMTVQLSYPAGDPIRDAIIAAYGEVQRKMVIAGSAFVPLVLLAVLVWRNVNVKNSKQTKGNVW